MGMKAATVEKGTSLCDQNIEVGAWFNDVSIKVGSLRMPNVRGSDERFAYTEDDIPVCTCKLADDAEQGCEEGSINRSMRFECVVELCPCGEHSSNRQLQLGSTFVTAVVDCGGKGVGVITREDVKVGRFIGEYVAWR
ncbi:hypothetical protein F444_04606 [Phytophthora nicotianae P1976]|uniref:AWS domain-containing protein n=1 Tax=Phytophthora nicotianae P1976 TaxID=1317066 RepID=A0A081AQ56_PHYNI|nr:hypothetical protein F444_04606 [Phytophthora nicotianae P1976]